MKAIRMFSAINHKADSTDIYVSATWDGDLNEIAVNKFTGEPTGKTLKESAISAMEDYLRKGCDIKHTGILGPEGATEFIDWSADYEEVTEYGIQYFNYAETDKKGKVRGTLARIQYLDGVKTIISKKKTFRTPE